MIHRLIGHLRGNAVAYLALFIALGGTSYAATSLPRGSVGTRQLRNGAVTPAKLAGASFGGHIFAYAQIYPNGTVAVSRPKGVTTKYWNSVAAPFGGLVVFPRRFPRGCAAVATPSSITPPISDNQAVPSVAAGVESVDSVAVKVDSPGSVALLIACPTP